MANNGESPSTGSSSTDPEVPQESYTEDYSWYFRLDLPANATVAQTVKELNRFTTHFNKYVAYSTAQQNAISQNHTRTAEQIQDIKSALDAMNNRLTDIADSIHTSTRGKFITQRDLAFLKKNPVLIPSDIQKKDIYRLPDGRINPNFVAYRSDAAKLTAEETALKHLFPAMKFAHEAPVENTDSANMKVTVPPNLKIYTADHTTLPKLAKLQTLFTNNLIPYKRWPLRVACEMSGDFYQLAEWARNFKEGDLDWAIFVEGVVQVLDAHQALSTPIARFTTNQPPMYGQLQLS